MISFPRNLTPRLLALCLAAVALGPGASPARAQAVPRTSELSISASAYNGYDTDLTGGDSRDPRLETGAVQAGGSLSMKYDLKSERILFSTSADAFSQHSRSVVPLTGNAFVGSAGLAVAVTPKLRLTGSVRGGYLPYFHFSVTELANLTPEETPLPTFDYRVFALDLVNYQTSGEAIYTASSRSSFHLNYSKGTFRFLADDTDMSNWSMGGGYSRILTRYATLRIGYAEQHAGFPLRGEASFRQIRNRSLDAGVNYSRPLSRTRRTTLEFGSGTTAVDQNEEVFYNLTGHASLRHEMGRTWNIATTYSRGLAIVGGFGDPFFADSIAATVSGFATRRLKLTGLAGYSNGDVGLGSRANAFESVSGTAGATYLLGARVGLFGNYFYHRFGFGRSIAISDVIDRSFSRHGFRAGVNVDIVGRKERKPRAAR